MTPPADSPEPDPDLPESLAARLERAFGAGVDPEVSLHAAEESEDESGRKADFSSALVARLSGRDGSFGRYRVKGEIARGGMGAILKIWDEDLHRHLAMKVILGQVDARPRAVEARPSGEKQAGGERARAGGASDTPPIATSKLARFLEEAQVTGQLDHPGIVPVHELGLDPEGRVYFTMKLVKGQSLKEVFDLVAEKKEGWSQTKALGVLLKVCEAMAYAHDKGVIHRDLKPANVMVGKFGEVHVMDWGLARILGRADERDIRIREEVTAASTELRSERDAHRGETPESPLYTMDGDVVGTPAYMPPEQAAGRVSEMGPHSDVYALGAMLYHLLAGHMPYVPSGARLNNYAVWGLVQQGPPTKIAQLARETPAELVAICEKAMARDWKARYRDMSEMAADLSAFLEHRVVGAYETGAWAETKKWVERNKPLAASLAAGVLLLVAGLVVSVSLKQKADANAALAENRRIESAKSEARAVAGEAEAKRQEGIATQRAADLALATEEARRNERLATGKTNDVLSLSAIQDLKDLEDRADALWPADPENVPKYEAWLADARILIEGQPPDEPKGVKGRPSLAQHEAKLAEIRLRAKPLAPEQVEADRKASPSYAEWEKASAQLQWMKRMLGEEPWPSEEEVEAALAKETLPTDANGLNDIAWKLVDVDPARIEYGTEVRGLVLARRAVAAAVDAERAGIRDTLAWALYRCGRLDEALSEEQHAVEEAEGKQKEDLSGSLKQMQEQVALWKPDGGRSKQAEESSKLGARVAELEREVGERRTYEFEDGEDRWWHAQLSKLVLELKAFTDEERGGLYSSGTSEEHGWGIVRRAEFARTIEERSVEGPEAKRRWEEAIAAISTNAKYGGLKLPPQLGLLPIGADPESGLWEFAHLASGEPAERGPDGKLILKEEMGLVLVLIPGGPFLMGAQSTDPMEPNHDPQASSNESPVHEVTLTPYFLSKYEMTQGQWEGFTGRNPSGCGPDRYFTSWNRAGKGWSGLHPVEQVSWTQCMEVMTRLGLSLPSEAQWEKGARGGTDTVYWTGSELESLKDAANLSDAYGKSHGNEAWSVWEKDFDDGNTVHAEVGSYRANPFGMHDVIGNLWEWCLDGYDSSFYDRNRSEDPVAPTAGAPNRVLRGGGFNFAASNARVSYRNDVTPESRFNFLGLRPARASRLSPSQLHPAGK